MQVSSNNKGIKYYFPFKTPPYGFNPDQLRFILSQVSKVTGISEDSIVEKGRKANVALARHMYCLLSNKYTKNSIKSIGWLISKRDHATISNSLAAAKDLLETSYEPFTSHYRKVEELLIAAGYTLATDKRRDSFKQLISQLSKTEAA